MLQRIITGIVMAIGFLAMLQWGGYGFTILIILLALIGFYEFLKINDMHRMNAASILGFAGVLCLVFPWSQFTGWDIPFSTMIWLLLFLLFVVTVLTKNKVNLTHVSIMITGALYIGIGFHYMALTRLDNGLFWSYLIFACIWLTDIGAYFSGWAFGKRKLWPKISPNKTVEGAIGGTLLSIITAVIFSILVPDQLPLAQALVLGLIIAIVAQLGDLIQSAYKRVYGVKDSGTIFPGHGGVLDRTDSWIIVFPFVHFLSLI